MTVKTRTKVLWGLLRMTESATRAKMPQKEDYAPDDAKVKYCTTFHSPVEELVGAGIRDRDITGA